MWSNKSNFLFFSTFSEDREGEPYALFGGKNQKALVEVILIYPLFYIQLC